ncbi:MAG: class I SAM-dependent methyltransferase [Spirochaetes bacterium]|nr:class I SAM-dependent methyltransferase [Spirochaetota bacterium]
MINENYTENDITKYLNSLSASQNNLLKLYDEILKFDNKYYIPAVKKDTSQLLYWLAYLKKADNILEIGFGSGISAISIYYGYKDFKKFVSLERDNNRYVRGKQLFKKLNIKNIELIKIDAFNYFKENCDKYDLVFLDAVKKDYINYLELLKERMNTGALLICDNILFGDRVIKEDIEEKYKESVLKLKDFNEKLSLDKNFKTLFLPAGDGISISIKI